jgi:ATP phosphoribosyltransferase regulatory subunit
LIDTRETPFLQLPQLTGKRDVLDAARNVISNDRSLAALNALEVLWSEIESLGLENDFEIDLGDVPSLDYYTGLTLKVFVHGAGASVGRGGRYDGLTGNFGRAEPAIGFVLNLDALTEVVGRRSQK